MKGWVAMSVACAACGRLDFDPIDDAMPGGNGGMLLLRDKLAGYTGTTALTVRRPRSRS
jgi:hypothetical protein